ncbi:MAG: class I SAM-dependent methyltransferase [Euzebyales bacterium]|nr:class I SAM-dependent methyltransferase [Euzebyales bacterium]
MTGSTAAASWREALDAWAIPAHVLDAAPQTPHGFSVELFSRLADEAAGQDTPTTRAAADALPAGGAVLDIGCGGGAASLRLASRAGRLVGVDESPAMLEAFAERAARFHVAVDTFAGRWPEVAGRVPMADVAVCRNVVYNVPDLDTFAATLTAAARHRVVVELTDEHPMAFTAPFWQALHGIDRPQRPTVDDALAVFNDLGLRLRSERWDVPWLLAGEDSDALVAFLTRRLCVGEDRAREVRAVLQRHPVPAVRPATTVWWPGTAR